MNFKYKTSFENQIHSSYKYDENELKISKASLNNLKSLIPKDIDFEKNIDLLGVAFNAAVINHFNKNDDGIDTAVAKKIQKYFIHKPTNIEHNKNKIVGHIVSTGFYSKDGNEKLDVIDDDDKSLFNLSMGAVVYSHLHSMFAEAVEESTNNEHENFHMISASWELGFNDYYIASGSRNLSEAEIVTSPEHIKELSKHLKAFDGSGEMDDGTPLYRLVVGEVYPLGIGFTSDPAADVQGLLTHKKKDDKIVATVPLDLENLIEENNSKSKKNKKNISQSNKIDVINPINQISIMDKKELMENFKALLEEKMPEHNFSQEAVANIGRVIGDAIKSKSDQYEKELVALEEEKKSFAEAEAEMKKDLEDLRSQLQSSEDKISSLSNEITDRKSEDLFNSRMEEVDASYELSEQDRKLLVQEVQSLDNEDSSFEQYKEKLAVMWAHKSKEYIAEQEKAFQEKLEAELAKRLQEQPESKEEKTEEVESEDQVEEALANTKEEVSEVVTNNNSESSIQEPTLKEKFAQAFARENVKISL
jgi:hypothetical protein